MDLTENIDTITKKFEENEKHMSQMATIIYKLKTKNNELKEKNTKHEENIKYMVEVIKEKDNIINMNEVIASEKYVPCYENCVIL
uniref:Uncharacterized protein n=1 Tax=viral metagenome TaxID=1070528 RepID=A0A6C0BEU2_9ZZZZ